MNPQGPALNLSSARAKKARLAKHFSQPILLLLIAGSTLFAVTAFYCLTVGHLPRAGYFSASVALFLLMTSVWAKQDLHHLPHNLPATSLDDIMEPGLLASLRPGETLTPQKIWGRLIQMRETRFLCNHLLVDGEYIKEILNDDIVSMQAAWQRATAIMQSTNANELHNGILAAAILHSPELQTYLVANKVQDGDVAETTSWMQRLTNYAHAPKPHFGGIGRDWAVGFTPVLEQFSSNISQGLQVSGGFMLFTAHADLLDSIVSSLERGSAVALVGPAGSGKATLVHALAGRLLEGRDPKLRYYQVVSLNASLILSNNGQHLENILLQIFNEAMGSGNMILYLEDAELFFSTGTGALDMSQILLPVVRSHNIKVIAAVSPSFWQQLQSRQQALTSNFASVVLTEPPKEAVLKAIEDNAITMEQRNGVGISYEAVREAYRLSGQYMQDEAYPGKAINLLEQSLAYAENSMIISAQSVQTALERTRGVKVSRANAPETAMLLNLEDRIHDRMINQVRAVNVVAAALRRGRAGVSNPSRPVGSFLFLGPTGVGKTELARSLAAVYFGDENQMIRLDMSEYQQAEDVSRLIAGSEQGRSLLAAIREQPFSVVLLDEIEKAHPNILNLLLQMLDEGQLTDTSGRTASFRSSIIIATSNAGSSDIINRVKETGSLENFERTLIDKLIAIGQFRPELINRFDEVVLFRPLNEEELAKVAEIMLRGVNKTLAVQQITVQLTPEALRQIVHLGYDPEFGARPMRRMIQKTVENAIAMKILRQEASPGSVVILDVTDLALDQIHSGQ